MFGKVVSTEEGRTRSRNFFKRLSGYFAVCLILAVLVSFGAAYYKTRYGYKPLQRLYLKQYVKASFKSFFPRKKPSNYTMLVRVVDDPATGKEQRFGVTDRDAKPIRDERGKVKFDPKLGPFFKLNDGIPYKYIYWTKLPAMDKQMYQWMREDIYQGQSLLSLYWLSIALIPMIFLPGFFASIILDVKANRAYEKGQLQRGTVFVTPKEYGRKMNGKADGINLMVVKR